MGYVGSNTRRDIRSFEDVEAILGGRDYRKVGNNTYLIRRDDEEIALRLHATDILTFCPDRVIYNTGGWETVTTKARLNAWGPLYIFQRDWEWFTTIDGEVVPFEDYTTVGYDGKTVGWSEEAAA